VRRGACCMRIVSKHWADVRGECQHATGTLQCRQGMREQTCQCQQGQGQRPDGAMPRGRRQNSLKSWSFVHCLNRAPARACRLRRKWYSAISNFSCRKWIWPTPYLRPRRRVQGRVRAWLLAPPALRPLAARAAQRCHSAAARQHKAPTQRATQHGGQHKHDSLYLFHQTRTDLTFVASGS